MFDKLGKYIPHRKCVGCQKIKPKDDLIRIVKTQNGLSIDQKHKLSGRGVYICKNNTDCLNAAIKKKAIERSLKIYVPKEFYDELKSVVESIVYKSTEVS